MNVDTLEPPLSVSTLILSVRTLDRLRTFLKLFMTLKYNKCVVPAEYITNPDCTNRDFGQQKLKIPRSPRKAGFLYSKSTKIPRSQRNAGFASFKVVLEYSIYLLSSALP